MADENKVLGIRLDAEERKRFDEFVTTEGKSNKEFINTLLNIYELNKGKVKNVNLIGDIEALEGYTNKIHQTFINIIDKLENQKGDIEEHSEKDLQIYKDKVNELQSKIDTLKAVNTISNEKLTEVNSVMLTLQEQNNQLNDIKESNKALIEEYKGKNDMLLGQMKQYEKYPEQVEELKQLLINEQTKALDKDNIIKDNGFTINALNNSIEKLNQDHKKSIDDIKKDNAKELEQLKKESELNTKLVIAEVKEDLNNKLNQQQLKHNVDIEQYQAKYKDLLEELEKIRAIPKAIKKDNAAVKK